MKITVRVVGFLHVNWEGAETWQLLAELLCPWLLGFPPPPSTHNGTLSLTLINAHTCLCICGHMHSLTETHKEAIHRDTCAKNTHCENDSDTSPLDICCHTCSRSAGPAAPLMSHALISIRTTAPFTQTSCTSTVSPTWSGTGYIMTNHQANQSSRPTQIYTVCSN